MDSDHQLFLTVNLQSSHWLDSSLNNESASETCTQRRESWAYLSVWLVNFLMAYVFALGYHQSIVMSICLQTQFHALLSWYFMSLGVGDKHWTGTHSQQVLLLCSAGNKSKPTNNSLYMISFCVISYQFFWLHIVAVKNKAVFIVSVAVVTQCYIETSVIFLLYINEFSSSTNHHFNSS